MLVPPDPSLRDLQLLWESQFWGKSSWRLMCDFYERLVKYFGETRKPRDIFRSDVAGYGVWLRKKGWVNNSIHSEFERGARLYRLLDDRELVEKNFNPFLGMAPRRVRLRK